MMNINRGIKITRLLAEEVEKTRKETFPLRIEAKTKRCQVIRELHIYFIYADTFFVPRFACVLIEFSAH